MLSNYKHGRDCFAEHALFHKSNRLQGSLYAMGVSDLFLLLWVHGY